MARHRLTSAWLKFGVTLLATVALDLTQAILLGVAVSALVFMNQIAALAIDVQPVAPERLRGTRRDATEPGAPEPAAAEPGAPAGDRYAGVRVAYLTGPLFWSAAEAIAASGSDATG